MPLDQSCGRSSAYHATIRMDYSTFFPMTAPVNLSESLWLQNVEHRAKGWVSRNGGATVVCEQARVVGPRVPHSRHALFTVHISFFCRRLRCAFLAVSVPRFECSEMTAAAIACIHVIQRARHCL